MEGGLIGGGSSNPKGKQACILTVVDPMNILMLTPRFTENEPRMTPYRMRWRSVQSTENKYDLNIGQTKELEFDQSKRNAMPQSLVNVVKRNEDDSRGEINHQKKDQIREEVHHIRLKQNQNEAQQAVDDHQRLNRHTLKIAKELMAHQNFRLSKILQKEKSL